MVLTNPNELAPFKYALTIPGTNTMQLAYLNIPFFMILPTHNPNILRLDGALGLIIQAPILGHVLRRFIIQIMARRPRLYALPNQYFKQAICPEWVGSFSMDDAKDALHEFLNDPQQYEHITRTFQQLRTVKDPLDTMLSAIQSVINQTEIN